MAVFIETGALSPSLESQLLALGFEACDPKALEHLQRDLNAITRCHLRGWLNASAATKARKQCVDLLGHMEMKEIK